ncbi:MAG TPA: peptide ABC transporter substrate-binding protein [Tissierellales bacterium]|nr:peptide ABC transporter substrate-binding protein [Tissierellales bacterium]
MSYKKLVLVLFLIITLLFTMTGCNEELNKANTVSKKDEKAVEKEKEYEPVEGGELVLPLTVLSTLNPLISENISYHYFSKLIFEGMFELDEKFNIENILAEDYSIKNGGKVVDIKLRDDVYWHDGEKLTSEDVLFTINTIKHADNENSYKKIFNNSLNGDIKNILDVEIIDANNLEITFDKNYSNCVETLIFPIIPKHVFAKAGEGKKVYENALKVENYKPIGTGPYKFISYEKFKSITLEANDNWWKGKTYIETVIGKVLENEELMLTAFETDQVDMTLSKGTDWEKYAESQRVNINEYVSNNYEFLGFNFNNETFKDGKNKGIRKALAYGIDRQAIIEEVYLNHGTEIDVPINPNSWLASDNANTYQYNLSKAKEELEKAGWKDRNGDGICEDEKGNKLTLRLTTNSYNLLRLKTANMITGDLRKLGIEVIKDYSDTVPDNLTEEMVKEQWESFEKKIAKGDFDIALLGWELSSIPELSFAFHSSQIKNGTNFIRYNNKKMDNLLVDAFSAMPGDKKQKAYEKLEKEIVDELPYISLLFRNKAILSSNKIQGDIKPNFNNVYNNIENWYIPKEYQKKK